MLRAVIIIFLVGITGTAFASMVIKGQMQIRNLTVNTSSSGGGGGSPTGALELEQSEGVLELEQSEGVLLYE